MNDIRPISLLICALGGEGGGVLTEWLIDIARHAGYAAQSTSIPGVAQRTGATTYYVEVFPIPVSQLGGRRPVFSLNPVPGALDAMVSSELLETARQIGNGMSTPQRTLVISSSGRTLTTQERMQLADGRADSADLVKIVQGFSREHHVFDMGSIARESGTVVSAVMLGAIAGSGLFPFRREDYETVVRGGDTTAPEKVSKMAAASLRGFARAYETVSQPRTQATMIKAMLASDDEDVRAPAVLPPEVAARFPPQVQEMLTLGYARMLDYQDAGYAWLYLERLRRVLAAEREIDPSGANDFATTREMARWLALWMAFDDIVRVADLKSRASRWSRVQGEVKAGDDDLLQVYDHFKPGAPEFAALLPPALSATLLRWDRKRVLKGKAPWALPLKIGSHSVLGMLSLRTLASLKWLRVRGARYAGEQAMIEKWLGGVLAGSRRHWRLGHEIALCGRLIKGYGATNERGKDNLLHVLDHLAPAARSPEENAASIAAARTAALADDAGIALDATLVRHGAPARPVKEQPLRFIRKIPALQPAKES
ncbi:indolepyruvate oxidoreductase subunit beta family protein [Caenimonas terrae]|uniref:Indolepyruvate oxidoreductase subunit beta family protein n=1 Tax=Caenimonas terrae TaxID=696074 RepID=A0ABW0NCQ1_9BURK